MLGGPSSFVALRRRKVGWMVDGHEPTRSPDSIGEHRIGVARRGDDDGFNSAIQQERVPAPTGPDDAMGAALQDRQEVTEAANTWSGRGFDPFVVGDPGQASYLIPRLLSHPVGRPDTAIDGGTVGELEIRAASVRGLSHRYYGITRPDDYS